MKLLLDDIGNTVQIVGLPPAGNTVSIASAIGLSVSSNALDGTYRFTTNMNAFISASNSGTGADMPLYSGQVEYFHVNNSKVSAYCSSAGGTIYATKV